MNQPDAGEKNFREKYGRWDKFSRRREKTVTETEKLVVFLQKKWRDNCLSDGKFSCFPPKKHVSVTDIWGNEIKNSKNEEKKTIMSVREKKWGQS